MSATFSVKNFDKFQHYSDRTPPWIKLYNALLDNYEFCELPDASKAHLVSIWLLASRSNNKIPLDPKWVAKRISASTPVDLNLLKDAGFIEFDQPCSNLLAAGKQDARPEIEGETEVDQRKILPVSTGLKSLKSVYSEDFEAFWKAYPTDSNMPKKPAFKHWQKLSPEKRQKAADSIPAFRRFCDQNKGWYRVIYADRFLSQEKFEGYASEPAPDPQELADIQDRADRLKRRGKYAVGLQ